MALGRLKVFLVVVVIAILGPRIYRLVAFMRFGKVIYNNQPGPCQVVKGIENGSEDMQLLQNGKVFITSGLKFDVDPKDELWASRKGQIMILDVNSPEKGATPVQIEGNKFDLQAFNPHGISLWRENEKNSRLFVVNHPIGQDSDSVEVFSFLNEIPSKLQHKESIQLEYFPNDLVAVGPRQFYFTKYRAFREGLAAQIEMYSSMKWGGVGYYDGSKVKILVEDLFIPNGINKSPDGRYIYVANVGDQEGIITYERKPDGSLVQKSFFPCYSGPIDNIEVEADTGNIWAAVHPVPHKVIPHMKDPSKPAPSQVLYLSIKDGEVVDVKSVYEEDGNRFVSASSIAVQHNGKLLIGTINNRAVMCDIKNK